MAGDQCLDSATIKLLIDRERESVVLAEAGQDYQDMFNSVLGFPMATVVRLARTRESFEGYGCFTNLYRCVEGLSSECFMTPACKQMLLHPRYLEEQFCRKRKVIKLDDAALTKYFTCPGFCKRGGSKLLVSYYETGKCDCGKPMDKELYVQDQCEVKEPSRSRIEGSSSMAFVTNCSPYMLKRPTDLEAHGIIKCISQLEEKATTVGLEQISCLLLNSAVSKTALTDTFLIKKQKSVRMDQPLFSSTKKSTKRAQPLTIDVVVRKSNNRILFAIADKQFIDLLFTFLTLPLVTVWHMIDFPYWLKGIWLAFQGYKLPPYYSCHSLLPNFKAQVPPSLVYSHAAMPDCAVLNAIPVSLIDPKSPSTKDSTPDSSTKGGYVKDETLFLVSDDLEVQHLASTSSVPVSLVGELGVSLFDIEMQKIGIGEKEALKLLEASFRTSSALNIALGSLLTASGPKHLAYFL